MSKNNTIRTYQWGEPVQEKESFIPSNLRSAYHFDPEILAQTMGFDVYENEGLSLEKKRKSSRFMNKFLGLMDQQA